MLRLLRTCCCHLNPRIVHLIQAEHGISIQCSGSKRWGCHVFVFLVVMQMVDACIQSCPIDTRRALYSNIVLSVRPVTHHALACWPPHDTKLKAMAVQDPKMCHH